MSWLVRNIIAALILPPSSIFLFQLVALSLWWRKPRIARILVIVSVIFAALISMPIVSFGLISILEGQNNPLHLDDSQLSQEAQAIVVLGAGRRAGAREYGQDTVSEPGLERIRYAVDLQRLTGKPILLTGGSPGSQGPSEAKIMEQALRTSFGSHAEWLEESSRNTAENAKFSLDMLSKVGVRRIFLVTHAWHMPRAKRSFEQAGFTVIAAPMGFHAIVSLGDSTLIWLPSAFGAEVSYDFFHEFIGLIFYRI